MRQLILIIFLFLSFFCCSGDERREVIFIDDVPQPKEKWEKLTSSEIFSFTEYRHGEAPERYNRGNDTIVIVVKTREVETKMQQERHTLLNRFIDSVDNGADILIVVDGILVMPDSQKQLRTLPSTSLSYVDTMEFYAAKKLYGSKARPTTLIINTYGLN